jgi:hypothetical protein
MSLFQGLAVREARLSEREQSSKRAEQKSGQTVPVRSAMCCLVGLRRWHLCSLPALAPVTHTGTQAVHVLMKARLNGEDTALAAEVQQAQHVCIRSMQHMCLCCIQLLGYCPWPVATAGMACAPTLCHGAVGL